MQFTDPLTPDVDGGWTDPATAVRTGSRGPTAGPGPRRSPSPLDAGRRTVVVAGDDAGPPARVLAERAGWPLLAEPTSGSRTGANAIRTYRLLLADEELAGRIEQVVVYGHPTLSRPVTRLLSRSDVEVVAVPGPTGWTDPGHRVSRVVGAAWPDDQPEEDLAWTAEPRDRTARPASAWLAEWRRRDAELGDRLDALLAAEQGLTPHHVAGALSAALPPHGLLFVGASNPVRDLDLMVAEYPVGEHRMVVANRGLAGIDGTVSSAIGAALARPRTSRAFALLGDVTFLHDTNGLVAGPGEERPDLMLVVVNDDGGSIFASLEQGAPSHADSFEKLFGTPHGVDLAALCAATGTPHRRVATRAELGRRSTPRPGVSRWWRPSYDATTGATSTPRSGRSSTPSSSRSSPRWGAPGG